ncbi:MULTISPECIES: pyridoxamine 5'-phosphate oxidase family protein [Burkholderia]|uniref:pyridoxamine 5'-phosphate oxidase family protein n=1 Tax=Burkholderia TaxID=32008 RepID=UPI00119B2125|nr:MULTISPECIES: pyridoxamine 5'-phosphate oxidase family protein [Burkholderia]TWC56938.1 hypothetical protein FB600_1452 [Burkholderia sp. SJZ089]TWC92194.1 hypothetical protein FBX98_14414 [Burkholderia sp. SJZ115]TWC95345.1 hypothetical protein FB601_14514 [Burkholderia sp. SJZ091]
MSDIIQTVGSLEACIGKRPAAADLKVIDHMDGWVGRWLAASPLAFLAFSDPSSIKLTLAGGLPGFASRIDDRRLALARGVLDHPQQALSGRGVALLFLIPGLGETMRINGVVALNIEDKIVISVQECYAHCAKALLRSDFWNPVEIGVPLTPTNFVARSRFMALATADASLHTDISPKGDPAGLLAQAHNDTLTFPDRPGNRRADSFRNILERPDVSAALLVPGSTRIMIVQAEAQLTTDAMLQKCFAVQDRVPKLVTKLAPSSIMHYESAALMRAMPWCYPYSLPGIDPSEIFSAHIKLNKTAGLRASLLKGIATLPGLMRKGLALDYKRNMY